MCSVEECCQSYENDKKLHCVEVGSEVASGDVAVSAS